MKKQQLTSINLEINKTNIANLNHVKGGAINLSNEIDCYSKPPHVCHTVTTRPDSLKAVL
jgi:hypothetical protein